MEWFSRWFLKSSLASLGAGILMGAWMAMVPNAIIYRPAHVHLNLLGFASMMIFGVAYHVVPRFTGHALHSRRLAEVHWWVANVGLIVLVAGFCLVPHLAVVSRIVLAVGALLSAVGAFSFIYNLWRTIDGPAPVPVRATDAPAVTRRLPLAD